MLWQDFYHIVTNSNDEIITRDFIVNVFLQFYQAKNAIVTRQNFFVSGLPNGVLSMSAIQRRWFCYMVNNIPSDNISRKDLISLLDKIGNEQYKDVYLMRYDNGESYK